MGRSLRTPLQGVRNIVRFNWHLYVLSAMLVLTLIIVGNMFHVLTAICIIVALVICLQIFTSLAVSCYIYDFSNLYKLSWLKMDGRRHNEKLVNAHAGFDETSSLLESKFGPSEMFVADFYDSKKHTEVSIRRARKAYPAFPNTAKINTAHVPLPCCWADKIFVIFSAHEIREENERISFFKELSRVLKPSGKIIVTEHLRDTNNFLAYNIGFLHFYSKSTWLHAFCAANISIVKEIKITPFVTTFILEKNGTAP